MPLAGSAEGKFLILIFITNVIEDNKTKQNCNKNDTFTPKVGMLCFVLIDNRSFEHFTCMSLSLDLVIENSLKVSVPVVEPAGRSSYTYFASHLYACH